jgi:hypothetical protein
MVRDFFSIRENDADIVSNPPFDLFKPFALRALEVCYEKVALIWLVRTLPAARWLQDTPLARILLLTPRPSMPPGHVIARGEKPGGGEQDFCWLIWNKNHKEMENPSGQVECKNDAVVGRHRHRRSSERK